MLRTGPTILAAISISLAAACVPSAPPPPPVNAQPLNASRVHDLRLDDVTRELRDALEARYGQFDVKAYKLPLPTGWPSVAAYYQGALSRWRVESALPETIRAAHARAWTRYGALFAIALIDTPVPGQERDYKLLVVVRKP